MRAGVQARAGGADVSFRDVTIETPERKYDRGMWMTSCTESVRGGLGGFEKSQLVEFLRPKGSRVSASEENGHRGLAVGADGKVSIERMCISLLMTKNLLTQR